MAEPYETPLEWDRSRFSPQEAEWIGRLAQRLEIKFNKAVVCYAVMHLAREEEYLLKERSRMFPEEPAENRRILLSLLRVLFELYREDEKRNDPDEIIKIISLNRSQVLSFFHTGNIVDAKTICALAFLEWL